MQEIHPNATQNNLQDDDNGFTGTAMHAMLVSDKPHYRQVRRNTEGPKCNKGANSGASDLGVLTCFSHLHPSTENA
jgi:hypothetical protein